MLQLASPHKVEGVTKCLHNQTGESCALCLGTSCQRYRIHPHIASICDQQSNMVEVLQDTMYRAEAASSVPLLSMLHAQQRCSLQDSLCNCTFTCHLRGSCYKLLIDRIRYLQLHVRCQDTQMVQYVWHMPVSQVWCTTHTQQMSSACVHC